jgi:hypothetical protein
MWVVIPSQESLFVNNFIAKSNAVRAVLSVQKKIIKVGNKHANVY